MSPKTSEPPEEDETTGQASGEGEAEESSEDALEESPLEENKDVGAGEDRSTSPVGSRPYISLLIVRITGDARTRFLSVLQRDSRLVRPGYCCLLAKQIRG